MWRPGNASGPKQYSLLPLGVSPAELVNHLGRSPPSPTPENLTRLKTCKEREGLVIPLMRSCTRPSLKSLSSQSFHPVALWSRSTFGRYSEQYNVYSSLSPISFLQIAAKPWMCFFRSFSLILGSSSPTSFPPCICLPTVGPTAAH